jgi:hypothetical protein
MLALSSSRLVFGHFVLVDHQQDSHGMIPREDRWQTARHQHAGIALREFSASSISFQVRNTVS